MKTIIPFFATILFPCFLSAQDSFYCATNDSTIMKEIPLLTPVFANFKDFIPWNTGGGILLIINHLK